MKNVSFFMEKNVMGFLANAVPFFLAGGLWELRHLEEDSAAVPVSPLLVRVTVTDVAGMSFSLSSHHKKAS